MYIPRQTETDGQTDIHTYTHTHTYLHTHRVYDYPVNYITLTTASNVRAHRVGTTNSLPNTRMFNRDCFVSGVISIPVILFSLKAKARRRLRYADCNHLELRNQGRNVDSSNSLKIVHQYISRLRNNPDESISKNRYH
jgi:hypothetical protein